MTSDFGEIVKVARSLLKYALAYVVYLKAVKYIDIPKYKIIFKFDYFILKRAGCSFIFPNEIGESDD